MTLLNLFPQRSIWPQKKFCVIFFFEIVISILPIFNPIILVLPNSNFATIALMLIVVNDNYHLNVLWLMFILQSLKWGLKHFSSDLFEFMPKIKSLECDLSMNWTTRRFFYYLHILHIPHVSKLSIREVIEIVLDKNEGLEWFHCKS